MAAAWEFTLISEAVIPSQVLMQIITEYKKQIEIDRILSIDDWSWSNQQKIDDFSRIEDSLNAGKIITMEMHSSAWKSLGLYMEKEHDIYVYTFWINTEGFPELDINNITPQNKACYVRAHAALETLLKKYKLPFRAITIGLESQIQYDSDIAEMILKSTGVVVWLINNPCSIELPPGLKRVTLSNGINAIFRCGAGMT